MSIAVIIPTIRPERKQWMEEQWGELFKLHNCAVYWVHDGENPVVYKNETAFSIPQEHRELFFNFNDGIRNLGFYYAKKDINPDVYVTLDDDVRPMGNDPIQEHLDALNMQVPISWFSSTMQPYYMRGFPYGIRKEAQVMVSHGVWRGVPDLDAITQLTQPDIQPEFYRGPVPKGVLMPVCGMNLAWKKEVAQWVYFAPMGPKTPFNRFADIWMGISLKRNLDKNGYALVTGYSTVWHERASDVWKNLENEIVGLKVNECLLTEEIPPQAKEYFELYTLLKNRWAEVL
jgi:hypothetical protein